MVTYNTNIQPVLTQLSSRTIVCGCRINFLKLNPPPASEAPYALVPPVSSMMSQALRVGLKLLDRRALPAKIGLKLITSATSCRVASFDADKSHTEEWSCPAARHRGGAEDHVCLFSLFHLLSASSIKQSLILKRHVSTEQH